MKARDHGTGRKAYGYIVHQVAGFTLLVPGAQVAGSRASFFCPRHSPVVATRWSLVELTGDPWLIVIQRPRRGVPRPRRGVPMSRPLADLPDQL